MPPTSTAQVVASCYVKAPREIRYVSSAKKPESELVLVAVVRVFNRVATQRKVDS